MGLWGFLAITTVATFVAITLIAVINNKTKMKELEIEELKIKNLNIKAEVEAAVEKHLKNQNERIQTLEAIVTDKQYELNVKITSLR